MLVDFHRRLHIRVPENLRHHLSWRATHHRLCSHRVTEVMPTWPRIVIHATREFEGQGSNLEAVALAADIWEAVLRSVAKAFHRKGEYASTIEDFESYLLTAFHHRFHRFLKAEHERHEIFQSVSRPPNLDLLETTQNAEWASELERKIAVRQVTDRMDGWTKKVWQARQYGYSWKELSTWLGITEHQAKMKFQYGLEKTRASLLRSLKAAWVKKSG
jgi:DNA-directed RNA polymerase specialized sigma24 family protein